MSWIKTILEEIWGLFVDDGKFALVIVVWLLVAWKLLPLFVSPPVQGLLLVLGLLAALGESALRKARR